MQAKIMELEASLVTATSAQQQLSTQQAVDSAPKAIQTTQARQVSRRPPQWCSIQLAAPHDTLPYPLGTPGHRTGRAPRRVLPHWSCENLVAHPRSFRKPTNHLDNIQDCLP